MRRIRYFLAALMALFLFGTAVPYDWQHFQVSLTSTAFAADYLSQPVYFNVQTLKIHKPT